MKMFSYILFIVVYICTYVTTSTKNDVVLTPFGWWPHSCVHGVESGSEIVNEQDYFLVKHPLNNVVAKIDRCDINTIKQAQHNNNGNENVNAIDGDGWQVYVKQDVGSTVSALLGDWIVPANPSKSGQTLFTFTGLQNIDWVPPNPPPTESFDIIQPVLQYGVSDAGGGSYWSIASWYVTLGRDVVYSKLQKVDAGDRLFGNMTKTGDDTWFINAVDLTSKVSSYISVTKSVLTSQPWIYVTLEVYDVFACEQYPEIGSQLPYTNLVLYEDGQIVSAQWQVGTDGQNPPICNATIEIVSDSAVTITW